MTRPCVLKAGVSVGRRFIPHVALWVMLGMTAPVQAADFSGLFSSFVGQSGSEKTDLKDTLMRLSKNLNRKLPQTIDADTRLVKVSAEPGQQFAYHYILVNLRSQEVDTKNFYKLVRPVLQKRVCAAEDLKTFFINRVTVAYAYRGKDGADIGKLAFTPKDCGYAG